MSIRSLRSAMAFLTVLPVTAAEGEPGERLGRAYFPVVGAFIGLLAGIAFGVMTALTTPLLAAVAATAMMAVLTGALHLDGVADAADGLLGGGDIARRLEVMRDPRLGSFGTTAVVLVLAGSIAAIASMTPARAIVALVIAGAMSRLAMLAVVAFVPYVRHPGLGSAAWGGHRAFDLVLGSVFVVAVSLLDWRRAAAALTVVAVTAVMISVLARRRIGGATGDVYGATAELCQLAALVVFAARA
jgi:adenosylcobinamide-GDP ribazoletransferase